MCKKPFLMDTVHQRKCASQLILRDHQTRQTQTISLCKKPCNSIHNTTMVLPGLVELEAAFQQKGEEISVLKDEIESLHSASAAAAKSSSDLLQHKDEEIATLKEDIQSLRAASAAAVKSLSDSLHHKEKNQSLKTVLTKGTIEVANVQTILDAGLLTFVEDLLKLKKATAAATEKKIAALKVRR